MAQTGNLLIIPANADALTRVWLSAALRQSISGITIIHSAPLAEQQSFFGSLMRLTLDYAKPIPCVPTTAAMP